MKKIISIFLATLLLLSAAGCGQKEQLSADPTPTAPSPTVSSKPVINNLFAETGMLAQGQSVTLTPEQLSGEIVWSSSDPARLTVDAAGTVTALASRGTVTVTAAAGDQVQLWEIPLCEQTPYGSVSLVSSDEGLLIGVWNGAFNWFDETYMKLMYDAGINLLIGVKDKWIWEGDGAPMLDLAEQYGISIIADLRDWDGETVPEYAEYPALKGFLLFDEPSSPAFAHLANLKDQFEAVMPEDLMFFVNLFPEACSYESLFGDDYDPVFVDYEKYYLDYFMDTVKPECISYDAYALQEGGYIRTSYFHNFDIAAHRAKQDGLPFWYTLCTSGHWTTDGRYVTPTDKELRWQMLLGMTYGAENLTHYVLTSPDEGDDNMLQYASWQPTEIYDYVKQVNQEFLTWDDIYMSYEWVGTAALDADSETKWGNLMLTSLEYELSFEQTGTLTGASSTEDLLMGVFQKDGENAYLVTNAGNATLSGDWYRYCFEMTDAQVSLQLAEGDYRCAAVINRGQISYVPVSEDHTVNISVPAYDGVFVIPIAA